MNLKKFLMFAIILMCVFYLTACNDSDNSGEEQSDSNNENASNDSGDDSEETVTLEWMMWADNESEAQVWEDMANEINEEYPNIVVELNTLSFNDYWTRLQTMVASNEAPDIISMQSLRMPGFGAVLHPLDEFIENDEEINIEDFDPSILENMHYEDAVAALPYDVGPYLLYYNKDLFDKHGVSYPDPGWTMDDFDTTIEQLSKEEDYGVIMNNTNLEYYIPYIYSNSGEYLDEDGGYKMNGENTIETMNHLSEYVANGQAPELVSQAAGNWQAEQWLNGDIGMLLDGPWNILWFLDETDFDYGVVPVPEGSNGSVTVSAGSGFGVSNDTEYPEEAYKAVKYLTNSKSLNNLASMGRAYPARTSAVDSFYENVPEEFKASLDYASENSVPFEITNTWNRAQDIFTSNLVPIMNGMVDAEEGMEALQEELEAIEE
ncbi:ABC transporter substrate-binding protein [Gracilibacillus massiliensis]|uniref:ABC transporter substrate-binding protein n=1 Tax=Gracilibacillus massiliensis TaxID=1564956 RepID=UPI00071E0058|nr:sugar ABC transporter substrate-binding protein [Gracilibacillus massiliensis]